MSSMNLEWIVAAYHQFGKWEEDVSQLINEIKQNSNLILGIDYSEMYQYMHFSAKRHKVVSHILKHLNNIFTIPPGSWHELFIEAQKHITRPRNKNEWHLIKEAAAIQIFLREFKNANGDSEAELKAYMKIDSALRQLLETIISLAKNNNPWKRISELLDSKVLSPLNELVNVDQIKVNNDLRDDIKKLLDICKKGYEINNGIDSLNYAVIAALNEWQSKAKKPIIMNALFALFTGSSTVVDVFLRYPSINTNYIRKTSYLKYMTNLNVNISEDKELYLRDCLETMKILQNRLVTSVGPLAENLQKITKSSKEIKNIEKTKKRMHISRKTIDLFRDFYDRFYKPLFYFDLEPINEIESNKSKARELYEIAIDQNMFHASVEAAYSVLNIFFDRLEKYNTFGKIADKSS